MSITTPALLEVRSALRKYLTDVDSFEIVLVGCSGGADSLALAHALYLESKVNNFTLIPIVIDHDLQKGSAEVAARAVAELQSWGIENIFSAKAQVVMSDGLEASARRARYQIFEQAIDTYSAKYFFLAHTMNDQAESVLLGLARGSGTKSLSGIPEVNGKYIRPLLAISRAITEAACAEANILFWSDPHNRDQQFTRVRVRENILPAMERDLGPGISEALARSASILGEDAQALDQWAAKEFGQIDPSDIDCQLLIELPKAIRSRLLRRAIYAQGAPSGSITAQHLAPVEALITDWKGQGEISLPGGVKVARFSGRLSLSNP